MAKSGIMEAQSPGFSIVPASGATARPRVLVLSHSGGGAHLTAAEAIESALSDTCDVFTELTYELGADAYNRLLALGWSRALAAMVSLHGASEVLAVPLWHRPLLERAVRRIRPSLIISTTPAGNGVTWRVARALGIPLLILPVDLSFAHFIRFLPPECRGDPLLKLGLAFPELREHALAEGPLDDSQLPVVGYPLRRPFWQDGPPTPLPFEMRPGESLVLLMMGARGGRRMAHHLRQLLRYPHLPELHVVGLCGSNPELRAQIEEEARRRPPGVRVTALGTQGADVVAALMRAAVVGVSKPGGATVNEALGQGLPLILDDDAGGAPVWERGNLAWVQARGWGVALQPEGLGPQLRKLLAAPRPPPLEVPGRQFDRRLKAQLTGLLPQPPQVLAALGVPLSPQP